MTSTISSNKVALKWSLIYVIVAIFLTYVYQFLNVDQTSGVKYINYIPLIAFMLLAQKEYKDQLGGYLTFGQGFLTGFKYSVIIGVLMAIFMYIYWTLLSPQIFQEILDQTKAKLEAQGNLTDDQIKMGMTFTTAGIFSVSILIGSLIFGSIISLIGAAIFKKDKPPFVVDESVPYSDPAV